jgi:hypothetical protein
MVSRYASRAMMSRYLSESRRRRAWWYRATCHGVVLLVHNDVVLATWRQKWLDDTTHMSHNNGKKQAYLVCLVQDGLGDFVWWRPAAWQEVEKATGTIIPCSINTMSKPRRLVACGSDQVTCMMAAINHGIGQMGRCIGESVLPCHSWVLSIVKSNWFLK